MKAFNEYLKESKKENLGPISKFIESNYKHFNARELVSAAKSYKEFISKGGKMLVTLAGAMSTAELGISLAEMIRQKKVHTISCTGANLEEDIFNLVANKSYKSVPNYRMLNIEDEFALLDDGFNRVTDTCIPEEKAFRKIEKHIVKLWKDAEKNGKSYFPYEYMYQLIEKNMLDGDYDIDPKNSWLLAACEAKLPIVTPGWEDSTLGNIFASYCMKGELKTSTVKMGIDAMKMFADWYTNVSKKSDVGFFQIGGGIAGDFPICAVPMLDQDMKIKTKKWKYFCQISDSTTSFGGYSGAVPAEKITWGKLDRDTDMYVIESDASIVAPLIFAYVLNQ